MFLRFIYLFIACFYASTLTAQHNIKIEKIAEGFTIPVDIANAGDDRLFVVGKRGVIHVFDRNDPSVTSVYLDMTTLVSSSSNEKGLLGMAFHPDYKNNGYFFVNYSDKFRNSVVARYSVSNDPNVADQSSERILLTIPQPFGNHNGGCLKFGPDGYLYIGWGDGGSANDPGNRSQNGQELLGKMLRIDINTDLGYVIPPTNPFLDSAEVKNEIWAIGLRNPWRYSFDRETGDLWIGDVGQNKWEEVDFQEAGSKGGENYGWRCYEAEQEFNTGGCKQSSNYTFPVHFYRNQRGGEGCSITGGFVYRGKNIPSLYSHYVYADFCSGKIWALKKNSNGDYINEEIYKFGGNQLASFGEDIDGEIYFTSVQVGAVYKINLDCDIDISLELTHESCINSQDGSSKIVFNSVMPDSLMILWSNGSKIESANNLGPGQHWVKLKSLSCEVSDTFTIEPFDASSPCIVNHVANITLCEVDSIILESCIAPNGFSYIWYKDDLALAADSMRKYSVTEAGKYKVKWKNDNCDLEFSNDVIVTFLDRPIIPLLTFGSDTLWATDGHMLYEWYLNDTLLRSTLENHIVITESGEYKVKVGDHLICFSDFSASLYVIKTTTFSAFNDSNVRVYPIPATDLVTVSTIMIINNAKIKIFDANGSIRYNQFERQFEQLEIDVSSWAKGVYFIEIEANGKVFISRLIVD